MVASIDFRHCGLLSFILIHTQLGVSCLRLHVFSYCCFCLQRKTPVAVYTETYLLMMSSEPARNM